MESEWKINLQEKIFEPFYRIDKSRNDEGTGLGLSIVQSIVESLGGSVEVNSKTWERNKSNREFPGNLSLTIW